MGHHSHFQIVSSTMEGKDSLRSYIMSRVPTKNTRPEVTVRKHLHRAGYRFRLNQKDLPGSPDIVLPKYRLAIFVHGCFWHRHEGCKYATFPKTRTEFWSAKFAANKIRDENAIASLERMNWRTVVIWTCELKKHSFEATMARVIGIINEAHTPDGFSTARRNAPDHR